MRNAPELHAIIDAAEQAAASGNWAFAEELLREAVTGQEDRFGPTHPELANTLNNLGVVCEKTGKMDEAEQCYRRAYAIGTASLPPDDPLVVTSGQNLREFCDARGSSFERMPAPPAVTAQPEALVPRDAPPATRGPEFTKRRSLHIVAGVTIAVGLAFAVFITSRSWLGSDEPFESRDDSATGQPAAQATPTLDADPAAPAPSVASIATDSPATVNAERLIRPEPAAPVTVSVVTAQLCNALSADWRCTPATDPASPGLLFFYTRVKTPIDADVEHLWYYEGRLLRRITLRVGANQGPGYRTYSRNTISAERAGSWRVELRSHDGTVLHEEGFRVLN